MKLYLILLAILSVCSCGHIYVSDAQLHYQNTEYVTSAQLYFKLENSLEVNEVLKIVWPYTISTGNVNMSIYTTTSTTATSSGTTLKDTSNGYLHRLSTKLNADQWYILNISSSAQSPTVQYYNTPIKMSTHSGMTTGGLVNEYLMYDYNNACGFIAIAPAPVTMSSLTVSDTETGTTAPTNTVTNKYFEATYSVYLTFLTAADYEYGGTFYFKITSGFKWTGSCEAVSKNCGQDSSCVTVNSLTPNSDYTCSVSDNVIVFKRFQNSTKLSVNHQDYMRIKATVKNPSIVDSAGGVTAQFVSNYAYYLYEIYTKSSQFATEAIKLSSSKATYFWGLSAYDAGTKGCPVRIFISDAIAVWNKISFPFYPELTLPDSTAGFKLYVNVQATSVLNEISIYTDASAFGSDPVKCIVDISDATDKYIICKNIGKLASNQTKYIKFAFVVEANTALAPGGTGTTDYNETKLSNFGTMQIKRMDGETITTTAKPTDVSYEKKYDAKYAGENRVVDLVSPEYNNGIIATTDFSNAFTAGGHDNARSSIKYSKSEINLLFPIATTYKQTCCDAHNSASDHLDCVIQTGAISNAECKAINTAATDIKADSLILKIIANSNALTLNNDDKDSSTTAGNIYNGVELYPSTSTAGEVGFFGMAVLPGSSDTQANLCQSKTASGHAICSTYSINVTYSEAQSATTGEKKHLFNQWHLQSGYLELHTVCYAGYADAKTNVCGAAENAAGTGVLMRRVTLSIVSNHLYPHQSDLDFIMCFRYQDVGSPSLDVDGSSTLASSSLINAQIINFKNQTAMTASNSIFRIGILNYFTEALTTYHTASYVPTLLRVGGSLHTDEVTTNEGVAFFFNGANIIITDESLSSTMPLNPAECGSPIDTGMVCRWFNQKTVKTASTDMHLDYYPGLNAIIIGGVSITATKEFNFYIPVQIKAAPFTHAFFALIQEHSTFPTVTSVYKLFGTAEMDGADWVEVANAGATSFTAVTKWGTETGIAGTDEINAVEDYEANSADNTYGTLQVHSAAVFVKADREGWTDGSNIYPGATATEVTIDASIDATSTLSATLNDDLDTANGMQGSGLTHSASAHYMIHSNIKYWNGATINWTLANSSAPFQSRCADMAITSFYATNNTPTAYIVICPYEGKFSATTTAIKDLGTVHVQFSTWTWPDYYGQGGLIGAHLRYLWTDKLGNLQAYLAEKETSTARENCTLGSASSIFAKDTLQKKAQIAISPINSISLDPKTSSAKAKESMTINILVDSATSATATTPQCSSGLSKIQCSVSKLVNTFAFTLTNTDEDNSQSIPNSQVSLIFWLSSTSSTDESSSTYTATIVGSFYYNMPGQEATSSTINKCDVSAVWTSSSQEDRSITVNNPNRDVLAIGARTPFSFTFSASYNVLDISKFTIDLKFLATSNTNLLTNLRCAVYSSTGSTLLHLFDKFDYSSLSAIEFDYKAQDSTLNIPVEIGTVSYKFLCHGGEVISTAPSSSSLINVKNSILQTIAEGQGSDQSGNYASLRTVSSSSVANVTMTKTFDVAGQDSVYTFNVKTYVLSTTSANNVTTTSIRFKAGSYFYVEFARDISPRFNQMGIIRCYHENYPTYCKYESERRIAFIARTDLNHNQTYGHNFSIIGVQRPAEFQNYKKMYFALVPYLKEFNDLTYQSSDSIEDAATTDQVATTLPVVYYSQESGTAIRSTFTMKMHIKMPANTVSENIPIYVDFPGDFDEAMFLGWSPSCQFRNVQIDDNDTISNYANSCSLENIRRVKINMSSDSNNTDTRLYELTVSSIPTYHYEQKYSNAPLVWFGNSTANTVPIYKTNLGYFNGTFNLKTFTFSDSTKQLLTWDSNEVQCYIGTYRCTAKLSKIQLYQFYLETINSENFFYDIDSFTSSGTYSDYFKFNPSTLAVETGKACKEFEIAPKASTAPGYYQLKWNHEQTTYYSVLPPLFIIALNSQTELDVTVSSRKYDVPDGGRSLPIIFDFAGKMPETDVTIDGTAKSLEINGTNYITSKYVKFVSSQQTMKFAEEYTSSQIQFIVKGEKVTGTNEPDTPTAILSWTLSGTNQASYQTPQEVTVTVVNAITGTPELTLNNPESSSQGYQTITAKCTHSGTYYYVVSQDEAATQIEYSSIKTATEDANILETELGTVYTNPKRTFYGYHLGTEAEKNYDITITGKLQSEATHYLRMYCVNQMDTASESKDISWKQASNGGKPLVSTMKFESTNNTNGTQYVSLSTTQKKEVACIICKEAKVEKDKVFGTDGVACSEEGAVASSNTTNSTRRLLQTTTNATEYYVVMPDLFVGSGNLDDVKTTLESSTFSSALTASETLTGVKLNSISCSINSGYPATPLINSPSVSPAENSITFTWTGANNTDGFVFAGVAQYTNATVDPTALQLKKNSGYSFDAFNKAFYYQDTSISVTVSPTTKCLDYKYYWIATNEDPDTYQYTTGVKSGTTKTIGCPTFAGLISQSMFLIAFLFILMILA